jgi:hypothetical protein
MKNNRKSFSLLLFVLFFIGISVKAQLSVSINNKAIQIQSEKYTYSFTPSFTILYSATDPGMMMKPLNIKSLSYNVLTWTMSVSRRAFKQPVSVMLATLPSLTFLLPQNLF